MDPNSDVTNLIAGEAVAPSGAAHLVLNLAGYEGPLDVLLALARTQKVDLTKISVLKLADQYVAFINEARKLELEVAADYLVMAAWLTYLKSRLLLPEPEPDEELSGPELAALLTFRLQRLEAMREAARKLMQRDQLGRDVFRRGAPEGVRSIRHPKYELSLFELLSAYAEMKRPAPPVPLRVGRTETYTAEEAAERILRVLGMNPGWERIEAFLPPTFATGRKLRTALAATLSAGLELTRQGRLRLRQESPFGPIFVKTQGPSET